MTDKAIVPIEIRTPAIPSMGEIEAMEKIATIAAYSGFLSSTAPKNDLKGRMADAFFVMMYGRELGVPNMTALKTIYVIDGKPTCSGQLLLALMRRAGVVVEVPNPAEITDIATVTITRPNGQPRTYSFTKQMAIDAGLIGSKTNWKKSPREMMIWRAVSMGGRFECPDIVGGLYTTEELAPDTLVDETGTPIGEIITGTAKPVEPEIRWQDHAERKEFFLHKVSEITGEVDPEKAALELIGQENWDNYPMANDALQAVKAAWAAQPTPPVNGHAPAPVDELETHVAKVDETGEVVLPDVPPTKGEDKPTVSDGNPFKGLERDRIMVAIEDLAANDIFTFPGKPLRWLIKSIGGVETIKGKPSRSAVITNDVESKDYIFSGVGVSPNITVVDGSKFEAALKDPSAVKLNSSKQWVWVRENEKVQA